MEITQQLVVFDAADLEREAAFWATVLGGEVNRYAHWYEVEVDGSVRAAVQHAPDHVPPRWPDGDPPLQLHLDLYVPDIRGGHDAVIAAGASLLQQAEDLDAPSGFQVYADPAGHPFCLCWGREAWLAERRQDAQGA